MLDGMLTMDRSDGPSLPNQIYHGVRNAIRDGRLLPGMPLPASRRLADMLGVSRNTVTAAYELLAAEGVISVRPGAAPLIAGGTHLEAGPAGPPVHGPDRGVGLSVRGHALTKTAWARMAGSRSVRQQVGRLEPGTPALDVFPRDEWARALRRAARGLERAEISYAQTAGLSRFRMTLARYLATERGVRANPSQILVTPSTQACLTLIAACLADPGDTVWLEDPGYLGARAAFQGAGLTIVPMPVDEQGADPACMTDAPRPRLLYITPSHQYPTGVRMPLPRRLALLEKARKLGGVVIEDDYDSEFLFEGRPVASVQGLSSGVEAIYLGTFAKSLLPGVRVAYMVVPEHLADALATAQRAMGLFASAATQAALADYIETGHYRAHLRRIRAVYRDRGYAMAAALRAILGNSGHVTHPTGGVQLSVNLSDHIDDRVIARCLNQAGFGVAALSDYALAARVSGLVVGFADATADDMAAFIPAVSTALAAHGTQSEGVRGAGGA